MQKHLFLDIEGRRVAVTVVGAGKPILMLHGWGGNRQSWEPLINELGRLDFWREHLGIALDFPGFGESEEPAEAWGVREYARLVDLVVRELYKKLNLSGNFDLMVHSFGGRVAFKMLTNDFEHQSVVRVDKLVLVAAAGIKPKRTLRLRVAATAARLGKNFMQLPGLRWAAPLAQKLLYKVLRTHDYEKSSGVMRETFLKVIDEDLLDCVGHVKNPTLIVWGKRDSYVPFSDALLMHKKILGSKLITIDKGRHGIHKTHARMIAAGIVDFLHNYL